MIDKPNTWAGAFQNRVQYQCAIKLYLVYSGGTGYSSRGDFILFNFAQKSTYKFFEGNPYRKYSMECSFVGINATLKQYLTTKGSYLYLTFVVNGIETTGRVPLEVDKYIHDFKSNTEIIEFVNYHDDAPIFYRTLINIYDEHSDLRYAHLTTKDFVSLMFDTDPSEIIIPSNQQFYYPMNINRMTIAEMLQNVAVAYGMLRMPNSSYQFYTFTQLINNNIPDSLSSLSEDKKFYALNHTEIDYKVEDYTEVNVQSVEKKGDQVLIMSITGNSGTLSGTGLVPIEFENYVIDHWEVEYGGASVAYFYQYFRMDRYGYLSLNSAPNNWKVNLYGHKLGEKDVTQGQQNKIIYSPFLYTSYTSSLITEANKLYKSNEIVTVKGRIDPTFEPSDIIYIEDVGMVLLEEVNFTFNGSFKGTYKGRVIRNKPFEPIVNYTIHKVKVTGAYSYTTGTIQNVNPYPMTFTFRIANNVLVTGTVEANSTFNFNTRTTTGNLPELDNSFYRYYNGSLDDDVTIQFTETVSQGTSALVVVLPNQA